MTDAEGGAKRPPIWNWAADNAELCAIFALISGFMLCIGAIVLKIDWVTFSGAFGDPALKDAHVDLGSVKAKQVGYFAALNWSVYATLVMPLIVLFGLLSFRQIEPTLEAMAERGMVRRAKDLAHIEPGALIDAWRRGDMAWRIVLGLVFVLGAAFIAYDGWSVVTDPINHPTILANVRLDDPEYEFDWSISCLYAGSRTNCGALSAFGAIGYALVPGVSTTFAFIVAVSALRFMAFVASAGNKRGEWIVMVDARENDKRLGWRVFEPFFSCLLYWGIAVLFGLWLMVVQNSFLRDPHSRDTFEFIFKDSNVIVQTMRELSIPKILANWDDYSSRAVSWLFVEPSQFFFANVQTGLGVVLFGLVCALSVVGSWWLLRATAMKSKEVGIAHIDALAADVGVDTKILKTRIRRMQFWPIAWIGQLPLFLLMIVMFASLFSYRIILAALTVLLVSLIAAGVSSLVESAKGAFRPKDEDDE